MLIWGEGPCIDVYVWVDLDGSDTDATCLQDSADTAGYDTLTDTTYDTTSHQDILHCMPVGKNKIYTVDLVWDNFPVVIFSWNSHKIYLFINQEFSENLPAQLGSILNRVLTVGGDRHEVDYFQQGPVCLNILFRDGITDC